MKKKYTIDPDCGGTFFDTAEAAARDFCEDNGDEEIVEVFQVCLHSVGKYKRALVKIEPPKRPAKKGKKP